MKHRIRIATPDDVPAMHVVRRAVRENALSNRGRITEASYAPFVAAGSAWVAAADDGAILGFAALDLADASVWALFVHPDHEGMGIGRALHDALVDAAAARGVAALWLTTAPGTRAERFYRDAGWQDSGTSDAGDMRFARATGA